VPDEHDVRTTGEETPCGGAMANGDRCTVVHMELANPATPIRAEGIGVTSVSPRTRWGKKERRGAHRGGSSRSGAIAGVHWSSLIRLSSALGTKPRGREGSALYRRHDESDRGVRDCSEGSDVE
jgi:hypothetical protein